MVVGRAAELAVLDSLIARTVARLAGDDVVRSWTERWTYRRDPRADTSASDLRHEISPDPADEWLVAHGGWIVTGITRLPAS